MSIRTRAGLTVLAAASLAVTACGGSSSTSNLAPGYYITITSAMAFTPLALEAPAGATITVLNNGTMLHSVTEQAAPFQFVLGGPAGVTPFDTGLFTGTKTFVLPATLTEGTVLNYFCTSHGPLMSTPNGTITIRAAAAPSVPPGTPGY
jgi:plastocyanin